MLLPRRWLHAYCDPGLGLGRLAERLTMTGTKVERAYRARPDARSSTSSSGAC